MKKQLAEEEKFERMQNSTWARAMEKIFNIILLNLCFVLYSCIGLILLGIGPSLLTAFQILKEKKGDSFDYHLFGDYFRLFKSNFIIGNCLFYSISLAGFVIINCILYYLQQSTLYAEIGLYIMGMSALLLVFYSIIVFPIFAIYSNHPIRDRLRITVYLILINPLKMVLIGCKLFIVCAVYLLFPQFILILGFSTAIVVIYINTEKMILKMNNKFESQNEKELTA